MKSKLLLIAALFCTACSTGKHYAIYQYDNGNDYIKDGTVRIVDAQSGKMGYATADGKMLIKPRFAFAHPFENGIAKVTYTGESKTVGDSYGEYHYWDSDDWFYINKQGQQIQP